MFTYLLSCLLERSLHWPGIADKTPPTGRTGALSFRGPAWCCPPLGRAPPGPPPCSDCPAPCTWSVSSTRCWSRPRVGHGCARTLWGCPRTDGPRGSSSTPPGGWRSLGSEDGTRASLCWCDLTSEGPSHPQGSQACQFVLSYHHQILLLY